MEMTQLGTGIVLGCVATLLGFGIRRRTWLGREHAEEKRFNDDDDESFSGGGRRSSSFEEVVAVPAGPKTKYILSTSGRATSLRRSRVLLKDMLDRDVAYICVSGDGDDDDLGEDDESEKSSPRGKRKMRAENFCGALRGLRAIGGAVGCDMKSLILPYLNEIDPLAEEIGCVTTVLRKGDRLIGYNTDCDGFRRALEDGGVGARITIKSALLYGRSPRFRTNLVLAVLRSSFSVSDIRSQFDKDIDLVVNNAKINALDADAKKTFLDALKHAKACFDYDLNGGPFLKDYCDQHRVLYIPATATYWHQMTAQWAHFLAREPNQQLQDDLQEADRRANGSSTFLMQRTSSLDLTRTSSIADSTL